MAIEQMFTSLPTVSNSTMSDIICAVQGYVSPSNLGVSTQQTLQQVYNLFAQNVILFNAGDPNGSVAGSTYQFCWDTTNKTLYICVTSGTTSTAVWIRADINDGYTTTVTAAATTTLTILSTYWQFFTGSTTQTLVMPVASTLAAGVTWRVVNNSTGVVTIQSSGLNTIVALPAGGVAEVTCILSSGTTAASWNANISASSGGATSIIGTANQVLANGTSGSGQTGAVTLTTPQDIATTSSPTFAALTLSSPLTVGNGGTGIATVPTNGQIPIGNGTNYIAAAITAGTGISVTNGAGSITLAAAASVPNSFVTDAGTATPAANAITISGSSTGLTTTGSGSTVGLTGTLAVTHGGTGLATLTSNGVLYASGTTTIAQFAPVNSAVHVTNASGVPSYSSTMTNGQLIIGSTGATPTAATLTAGANISITNGAGSITITATGLAGFSWTTVTGTSQAMLSNNGYIANNGSLVTLTLPATSAVGDEIDIIGKGSGGWLVQCGGGQTIVVGSSTTTSGGTVASTQAKDSFYMICTVANTEWTVGSAPQSAGLTIA